MTLDHLTAWLAGPLVLGLLLASASTCEARRHRPRPAPTPDPTPIPSPGPSPNLSMPPPGVGQDRGPWLNSRMPPAAGFQAVGWIIAVADTRRTDAGWVECDSVTVHAGTQTLVTDFGLAGWPSGSGGDFGIRQGWGGAGFTEIAGNVAKAFTNDSLVVQPSDAPQYAYHWWGQRTPVLATNAVCWVEARVRVHGSCVLEVGLDFTNGTTWKNSSGTGVVYSDANPDWQVITVFKP